MSSDTTSEDSATSVRQAITEATAVSFSGDDLSFRRHRAGLLGLLCLALVLSILRTTPQLVHSITAAQATLPHWRSTHSVYTLWDTLACLLNVFYTLPYFAASLFVVLGCRTAPPPTDSLWQAIRANPLHWLVFAGVPLQLLLLSVAAAGGVEHVEGSDAFAAFRFAFDVLQQLSLAMVVAHAAFICFRLRLTTTLPPMLQRHRLLFQRLAPAPGQSAAAATAANLADFQHSDWAAVRRFVFTFNIVAAVLALLGFLPFTFITVVIFLTEAPFWSLFALLSPLPPLLQIIASTSALVRFKHTPAARFLEHTVDASGLFTLNVVHYAFLVFYLLLGALFNVWPLDTSWDLPRLQRLIFGLYYYPLCFMGIGCLLQLLLLNQERHGHLVIIDLFPSASMPDADTQLLVAANARQARVVRLALLVAMLSVAACSAAQFVLLFGASLSPDARLWLFGLSLALGVYTALTALVIGLSGALSRLSSLVAYSCPVFLVLAALLNVLSAGLVRQDLTAVYALSFYSLVVLLFAAPALIFLVRTNAKLPADASAAAVWSPLPQSEPAADDEYVAV